MVAILRRIEAIVEGISGAGGEAEPERDDQGRRKRRVIVPRMAEDHSREHERILDPVQRAHQFHVRAQFPHDAK